MKLLVRSTLVAAFGAALALQPVAAHADSVSHLDPAGDVRSIPYTAGNLDTSAPSVAEPTATLGDVTSVRVSHRATTVLVVMRFRHLTRAGFIQEHTFQFLTPTRNRIVFIDASPGRWGGKATMTTAHLKKVRCSLSHRIDYARNTVRLSVPRSCLGNPRAVRVGSGTIIGYGSKLFFDDARRTGGEFNDPFVFGPRIRR